MRGAVAAPVILERVLAHYSALGWKMADEGLVGTGAAAFHPDLLLEKNGQRLALRVAAEPLGTYEIGVFAARCKRARIPGLVVCESTPDVVEACDQARLDFLPAERVGEPVVVGVPRPISAPTPVAAAAPEPVQFREFAPPRARMVLWRWIIVAAIWIAAITASAYYAALTLGQ